MPNRSEYQPLTQDIDEDEEADVVEEVLAPTRSPPSPRRGRRSGSIDLSKLDSAFKRWTESIAQKVKRKKKVEDNSKKEIWRSVFDPPVPPGAVDEVQVKTLDHKPPMTQEQFDMIVQSVKDAITEGINPKMITKGSSGSYFARAKVDGRVQTVAVFKPKDEEPYGRLNPKTTKWLHRQFRFIIPFGRACLIPNLSYISEAAASLLDTRLNLNIVPPTQLVSLSSPAFFYDWMDRNAAKKGKPLPDKIGSMQYFLHGYTDASDFLRKHPWPGRAISDTFDDSSHRKGGFTKKFMSALKVVCGRTGDEEDIYDDDDREVESVLFDATENRSEPQPFHWSQALQDNFREELEKLVILDYLMLNTDRGADNYMIKYCEPDYGKSPVDVPPTRTSRREMPVMTELRRNDGTPTGGPALQAPPSYSQSGYFDAHVPYTSRPHIHIAAIDNSLSFPHEHPRGWRSYTYGWLYLPVTIIGRPFSQKTRDHFLPLLTSKVWWAETTHQLRKLFAVDPDFHPKMFRRQLAVIKGQAWNIVESLKHSDEGPLELTRRTKVLVWNDEVELTEDMIASTEMDAPHSPTTPRVRPASPHASINTMPLPVTHKRTRSQSTGTPLDFPPPTRPTSMEMSRPVSFSAKFPRVHPATTGVTVLAHMERLDAVEAGLKRKIPVDDSVLDDEPEEVDVGESSQQPLRRALASSSGTATSSPFESPEVLLSPSTGLARLPAVPEDEANDADLSMSVSEDLMAAMSQSTMQLEVSPALMHSRWASYQGHSDDRPNLDWMRVDGADAPKQRTVIVERLETVDAKPLLSCW